MTTLVEEDMHVTHQHASEQDLIPEVVQQTPSDDMHEGIQEDINEDMTVEQQAALEQQQQSLVEMQQMYGEHPQHELGAVPQTVEEEVIDDGEMMHEEVHGMVPEHGDSREGEPPIPEPVHHEEVNYIKETHEVSYLLQHQEK